LPDRSYDIWKSPDFVSTYLTGIRGAMPFAAGQIEVMNRLIAAAGRPVRRLLDVGCGDGILASAVLAEHPEATAVCVDFSRLMLDAAREKLAGYASQVRFVEHDLADPGWVEHVNALAPFDAVVSGLAIHHQTDDRKRAIYAEIHDLLAPGGLFVNIEHVASPSDWLSSIWRDYFADSIFEQRSMQGSHETREEVGEAMRQRMAEGGNILAPVEAQCQWLREIGYTDVDCFFKVLEIAVFGGRHAS